MVRPRPGKAPQRAPRPKPAADAPDTRDRLLRAAEELMLRDGYSATRVDEVIRVAGLSKGSFYHFFDSKESLGLATLERYYADRVARLAAGAYAAEPDAQRRARGFLGHASGVAEDLWSAGCLLASFASDAAGSSREIAKALRTHTDQLRARVAEVLAPFATAEMPASALADHFLVCVEGSIVLARIYGDSTYLQRGLERFRQDLERRRLRR